MTNRVNTFFGTCNGHRYWNWKIVQMTHIVSEIFKPQEPSQAQ